ncbi:hypothetical protein [Streptomyces sp. TP-A0875]|uniref:hypothetical protein n=1 Tax=Streptomyces sp. TP-A0875 TaxID=552354 RepID=UPI0006B63D08|nr:hypothetical protein [Streptomyces sp. TP-A0875]
MPVRAAWLLPGGAEPGQTREDTRVTPVGTWVPSGELTTRPGIVPGGEPFRATSAGAMDLQIGTGRAIAQGTTAQGAYPVAVDAPETVRIADGDAQHPRIDTVAVRVYDGLYDASGDTLAVVEVIVGEPDPTPAAPVLPAACVPLWDVRVPAGASAGVGGIAWTSALTDRRAYTVAVGGIRPGGRASAPGSYDGQYRDTGTDLERWNAAAGVWEVYTPSTVQWSEWKPLTTIATLGTGVTAGTPTPQVRDVVIGGTRTREFYGVLSTSGVGTGAFTLFQFAQNYRPTYERDFAVAGVPSSAPYRLYMATSGNVGTTGHATGMTSIPLDQLRLVHAPGEL